MTAHKIVFRLISNQSTGLVKLGRLLGDNSSPDLSTPSQHPAQLSTLSARPTLLTTPTLSTLITVPSLPTFPTLLKLPTITRLICHETRPVGPSRPADGTLPMRPTWREQGLLCRVR